MTGQSMGLHILYLHQYFVPPDAPGATRSYEMARRLVKSGHQVTLLTSSARFPIRYGIEDRLSKLEIDGISLIVLKGAYSNKFPFWRRIIAFLKFSVGALYESLKVRDVDLVFATSTPLTIAVPGIFAKLWHRCPMVFEVRDLWPAVPVAMGVIKNPFLIWCATKLERLAYRMSSRVVALSPGMAKGVAEAGFPQSRIKVIPNSSDIELFRVPEQEGKTFFSENSDLKGSALVTYTGTLGMVNGIKYLLEIAAETQKIDPMIRFLIIGDGMQKNMLMEYAQKLQVMHSNLWFRSPISKQEIPKLLSASTISSSFVIDVPELWNNSANKVFDAFAAGRPVLINHRGWLADFLEESGAGLVVPPDDSAAAARQLCDFIGDADRMERAREAASYAGEVVFNRDILAEQLRLLLEEAAQCSTSDRKDDRS